MVARTEILLMQANMTASHHLLSHVLNLARQYRAGEIDAPVYVALYVFHWQVARHGPRVAQRRSRCDALPDGTAWLRQARVLDPSARAEFLIDVFAKYELRGLRQRVGRTLAQWLRGAWPLSVLDRVPQPRQVLRMQAAGTRPVTVIADYPRLLRPVLDKADAFAFVCHDLEHAWQFFRDPVQRRAQQRLAGRLERALADGIFDCYLTDPIFASKFDYLAADMNTHVLHSLQYLRAILIEFHLRRDGLDARAPLSATARATLRAALTALLGNEGSCVDAVDALNHGRLGMRDAAVLEAALCA